MGCDLRKTIGGIGLAISIHAPAWGATLLLTVNAYDED